LLVLTSIPSAIQHPNGALAGFIISLVIMGLGTGGFKSNIAPLVAEQYTGKMHKTTLKSGEVVIVDPTLTTQRIFLYFYMMINAGSLLSLVTTFAEKDVGFWLAYALPTFLFLLIPPILWYGNKKYVKTPPRGSVLVESWHVFLMAAKGKWSLNPATFFSRFYSANFWDSAKPSYYAGGEVGPRPENITWDDEFVDEVSRAVKACKVFLFYPLYWISYDQMTNNLTSQAGVMSLHGVPNEIVNNLNPLSLVIMIPIMERVIYPGLRRLKINFTPIKRITFGFFFGALAMCYTSVLQHYIYKTNPCGEKVTDCFKPNGDPDPSTLTVWLQAPAYILIGISEIFASITGLEYAFTKAPERMKSVIMSIFLFQSALASALEFALVPFTVDPKLTWMYGSVGIVSFTSGCIFWLVFRQLDAEEDALNLIGIHGRAGFADEQDGTKH
jgi:POT family proton-dependent oligopeptide transporter